MFELTFLGSIESFGLKEAVYWASRFGWPTERVLRELQSIRGEVHETNNG
jgi:hypothetical protein